MKYVNVFTIKINKKYHLRFQFNEMHKLMWPSIYICVCVCVMLGKNGIVLTMIAHESS
jgi:hypothetical protein